MTLSYSNWWKHPPGRCRKELFKINMMQKLFSKGRGTLSVLASVISIFSSASGGGWPKHFAKQFGVASENMLFFHVCYLNGTGKALYMIDKYVLEVFLPFSWQKTMEKLLNCEIRHDFSLGDQTEIPPAAARCAIDNRNYTSEYEQCTPALIIWSRKRLHACLRPKFSHNWRQVARKVA